MLHESSASLPSLISRPRKRRRTATEVLAGYFDSNNISRDFFTDMANTDETIRAVNSIIARTSPLLMDSRFQHIASFKSQTHHHHRHSSLNSRLRNNNNNNTTTTTTISSSQNTTSPIDRRSKLMGRIQDISHLLLSDHYESEFAAKRSPQSHSHTSLNLPPSTCDTQPDNFQIPATAPSSPQNLPATVVLLPTPIQSVIIEDQSPRQPVLPELLSRQRSPSIVIMEEKEEEVSEPPLTRDDTAVVIDTRTHCQRASMTASPPTPTRSIASLTSHTSSKWPHTPDNEAGPSFPEIPESYSDYTASYHHHHHHHLTEADNTGVTIIQPQSPPSSPPTMWQQGPSVASTSKPPSVTGTPQWMMMTQVRHESSHQQQQQSRSRSFSLDNILSPLLLPTRDSLPPTPLIAAAAAPDVSIAMEVDTPSARAEDIRIPLVATPEREMSVASDHIPPKSRSRRRSRAVKVVESDEETEGERDRVKKPRESGSGGGGDHRKPMKLKIRIGPLNNTNNTSVPTSTTTTTAMAMAAVVVPASAPTPTTTEMEVSSSKEENPSSSSYVSVASGTTPEELLQIDALPPLIPGKARKRKAPPAKKGWKGWVEVEVDEGQRPPKGFSLDDLPVGERRTRSGKQFDG